MQCCCAFTSERKLGEYFHHPPSPRHFQIGFPKRFKAFQKGFQRVLKHFKRVSKCFKRVFKGFPKGFQRVSKEFQSISKGSQSVSKINGFHRVSKGFQSIFKGFPKGFKPSETGFPKGFRATSNPLENAFVYVFSCFVWRVTYVLTVWRCFILNKTLFFSAVSCPGATSWMRGNAGGQFFDR